MALIADKFTNPYVKAGKEIEFLNRFVIQFEYEGVNIKGELDRVIINHKQKTVTPLDFTYYPFTHSLFGVIVWAVLFCAVYFFIKKKLLLTRL
jgi:hypothetical protein